MDSSDSRHWALGVTFEKASCSKVGQSYLSSHAVVVVTEEVRGGKMG